MSSLPEKTLLLLRHAQTHSAEDGQPDKDRPLASAGIADAKALGRLMKQQNWIPDYVLCSPAARTRQTWESLNIEAEIDCLEKLYNAAVSDIFHSVQAVKEPVETLLIVGHNPAIYALTARLSEKNSGPVMNRLANRFSPGTLAVLKCGILTWSEIQPHGNTLVSLQEPLDYNAPASPARWT